jgi:transposase-like protein
VTVQDAIRARHLRGDVAGRDELLRYALRNGANYRQLADVVGCSESTVHGWLKAYKAELVGNVLDEPVPHHLHAGKAAARCAP